MKNPRPVKVDGNIVYVPLTKGYEAIVDLENIDIVDGYCWSAKDKGTVVYAQRGVKTGYKKYKTTLMHRLLVDVPDGMEVDHINGNGLDNRVCNLRLVSRSQNMRNVGRWSTNSSGYKGVSWARNVNKWKSEITLFGNRIYLGLFDCPKAAHKAYCEASKEYHGVYGKTSADLNRSPDASTHKAIYEDEV